MNKYHMAHHWLEKLVPKLTLGDLDRFAYQKLLNDYASEHERQTTMDFHHHLKCAILDAVDEGLIQRDPTRKAIIKGKTPREKKPKYLNQYELHKLLDDLDLKSEINLDWLLLLIAKTGMRFSEALALTPKDFDLFPLLLDYQKPDPKKVNEILNLLGLAERRYHLPRQLSGGQQQRVAIGRALITQPKLILADEPTGNLDSKNSQDVIDMLISASRHFKQTILMITHNNNLTSSVDRVFRVSDGILTDLGGTANEALS